MDRLELIRMDEYIGVYNPHAKKGYGRLANLYPTKRVTVKARASAFEGGYRYLEIGDIHKRLSGRKTISLSEYGRLLKKYGKR